MSKYSVLFVCLGNICRSPLAEGVFRKLVDEKGLAEKFSIDSCGTGAWHVGEKPHAETRKNAKKNGYDLEDLRARTFVAEDLENFDLIITMDSSNRANVQGFKGSEKANIKMLREFDPEPYEIDVPDPFYGEVDGFQEVFEIVFRSCENLLEELSSTV